MKNIFYILSIIVVIPLQAQWKTIEGESIHNFLPYNQFTINPYTNDIWLVNHFYAAVIKPDGSVITFGEDDLGILWHGDELHFGFTSEHIFFTKELEGLYLFDNYQKQLLHAEEKFRKIYNDKDTLFLIRGNDYLLKYTYGIGAENTNIIAKNCAPNNGNLYTDRGSYFYVQNGSDSPLYNDSYYLQSSATGAMLFKPSTNIVYLGQKTGITLCEEGTCIDTITPYNTTNMPSGNILEIEFDSDNNLWVAFGDSTDKYIALGKLEGSNWSEIYTDINSPIDFERFYGFEFDTLGNIWVASGIDLHTLMNDNSPDWLSTQEFEKNTPQLTIYPNPATNSVHIRLPKSVSITQLFISDINGKVVHEQRVNSNGDIQVDISQFNKGVYIIRVNSDKNQWHKRLVVE